jgi:hypothetical protein
MINQTILSSCLFILANRKCGISSWQSDAADYVQELRVRARSFVTLPLLHFCPENFHSFWLSDKLWLFPVGTNLCRNEALRTMFVSTGYLLF